MSKFIEFIRTDVLVHAVFTTFILFSRINFWSSITKSFLFYSTNKLSKTVQLKLKENIEAEENYQHVRIKILHNKIPNN